MTLEPDGGPTEQARVLAAIRERVDRWRGYRLDGAREPSPDEGRYEPQDDRERPLTATSRELLRWWFRPEPHEVRGERGLAYFKYWPHQRRAVETFVYLYEVCGVRRAHELWQLAGVLPAWGQRDPWAKIGAQLATGSGKTKVMSLVVAWAYLNAEREPGALGVGRHAVIIAPGLFVRDRLLGDFRPAYGPAVFESDPVVPAAMRTDWHLTVYAPDDAPRRLDPDRGALVVTNYHQLLREAAAPAPRGRQRVLALFEDDDPARLEASEVPLLDRFSRSRGLLVINDEAHHVWDEPGHQAFEDRAKQGAAPGDEEAAEAMAWIRSLRRIHNATTFNGRLGLQVDLSATLFEESSVAKKAVGSRGGRSGTRFRSGALFRHTAVTYDLPEAIRDGIVKRPVLEHVTARNATTREPQPLIRDGAPNAWEKYRNLLMPGVRRWKALRDVADAEGGRRPLLFLLCSDRGEAAEVANFLRYGIASREELPGETPKGLTDPETKETYFLEVGDDGVARSTVVEVHIGKKEQSNEKDWERIRAAVNLIDRDAIPDPGGAVDAFGEPVMVRNRYDVVVSVMMLKEGWDVRGVQVIVPLRPCDSRTLTEQILGRGLRKMHAARIDDEGRAELSEEKLYVIEHPSFEAVLDEIRDLAEREESESISHAPEYVLVTPREDEAARLACDVRLLRYEGEVEVVRDWREGFDVRAVPELAPRRPWREDFDETEIATWLKAAMRHGEEAGMTFTLPVEPSYRDLDHVIEAAYVLPLLRRLQKSHQHRTAVKAVVREYLEQRTFKLPAGLPVSFERSIEAGTGRVAMANLAAPDVSAKVIEAILPALREAMNRRLASTKPLLSEVRASALQAYQAVKRNVYAPTRRSVFDRAATDSGDEVRVAALLDRCADVEGWVYNHARVGYAVEYEWSGRVLKYLPDFVVRARIEGVEHHAIIEVKGRIDDKDKAKARRGALLARQLTEADGQPWHYVFMVESPPVGRTDITWWSKQSEARLADLLRRHEELPLLPKTLLDRVEWAVLPSVARDEEYRLAWPVYDLLAAGGALADSQAPAPKGWARLPSDGTFDRQCFVARVVGRSMEPGIPDGSWVLFRGWEPGRAPAIAALEGRRVLAQLRGVADPDTGGRYAVKRLHAIERSDDGAVTRVELRSDNRSFAPITLGPTEEDLRLIAEVVRVVA